MTSWLRVSNPPIKSEKRCNAQVHAGYQHHDLHDEAQTGAGARRSALNSRNRACPLARMINSRKELLRVPHGALMWPEDFWIMRCDVP